MKTKILIGIVLAALAGSSVPAPARAQEILLEGPLAGADAVRNLVLFREGRFFLTGPTISFSLLDTYRRHILLGLKAEYNIFDWLSVGAWGAYGVGWRTSIADQISERGVDDVPNQDYDLNFPTRSFDGGDGLDQQLGQIQGMLAIDARLIPFRGKFSLFGKGFFAVDLYINLGVGLGFLKERGDTDCSAGVEGPTCPTDAYLPMKDRIAVGPSFGAGATVYFLDWIGLNFEYRSTPFAWNQSGTDEYGASEVERDQIINENDTFLYWNHMLMIGVTWAFPFDAPRTE